MSTPIDPTRRAVRPGDTVISLSEILARLESKVSPGVIDDLLRDVLSNRLAEVRPGQLITAELMNQILFRLASLEVRVASLEARGTGGGPTGGNEIAITSVSPQRPLHINDVVQVTGRNFGFSTGLLRVTFDGRDVNTIDRVQSSDTQVVFNVPSLSNLSASRPAEIVMTNGTSTARANVTVEPVTLPQAGNVDVSFDEVTPGTISSGSTEPVLFRYTIGSRATLEADFTITPTISNVANAAEWQSRVQVLNSAGAQLPEQRIRLANGQQASFFVRLTSVPTVPAGAAAPQFTLGVDATAPGVNKGSAMRTFTLNQPTEQPDPNIVLIDSKANPVAKLQGTTVTLGNNDGVLITLDLRFDAVGSYDLSAGIKEGTNWEASVAVISQNPINVSQVGMPLPAIFLIKTLASGASATGRAELNVKRHGATTGRTFSYNLAHS
ncbi:MAG: hypothetical protein QOH49_87 [Acidobacteriota bacterium]|jgi:hypothetical protein|nr:hypothetical protein [Acidobacteriota bacterium]